MLTANELRIGNFIHTNLGDLRITEIYADQITTDDSGWFFEDEDSQLRPHGIPLTEEWLLKLGFIDPAKNRMGYRISVNSQDEICWYRQDNSVRYQTKGNGFTRDMNIKYVHRIQNLYFALTGKELEIKEPAKV